MFDVMDWQDISAPKLARQASDNPAESEARRTDAVVVMLRDTIETIDALKRAELRGGASAVQASAALTKIRQALDR